MIPTISNVSSTRKNSLCERDNSHYLKALSGDGLWIPYTIQIIILTFIVNTISTGLVGGIVIYSVQKKIDATIQKSLFEHQTKFSQIHAKRVEALEGLYQKFVLFDKAFADLALKATDYRVPSEESEIVDREAYAKVVDNEVGDIDLKLAEFRTYLMNNRLFLSAHSTDELEKILLSVSMMPSLIYFVAHSNEPQNVEYLNRTINASRHRNLSQLDSEKPNFPLLISERVRAVTSYTRILEKLYKSVADTEH